MLLSKRTIREYVQNGMIGVQPSPTVEQYQWASLDFRLGDELYDLWTESYIDLTEGEPYWLKPGARVLGHTKERITMPTDHAAQVTGRSTLGRLFVTVHQTAGWIDPGFDGTVTLEIANFNFEAVPLTPGDRVGQLVFFELDRDTEGYSGQYQDANRPQPSSMFSYGPDSVPRRRGDR